MLRKIAATVAATLVLVPSALAASWGTVVTPKDGASWGTLAPTGASWGTSPTTALASTRPVVFVENLSTAVSDADVAAALPAFQTSVSRDLASVWGTDALLTMDPAFAASADMVVDVEDYADVMGALGYHDVIKNRPTSRVFAATGAAYNESWQLIFSHELDEMLVDPWINRFALWNGRTWLVEVADPPESGLYAYKIDGVDISDFITPRWYDASLRGAFDFTRRFTRAGQIGRHGYASYWTGAGWKQVFGYHAKREP